MVEKTKTERSPKPQWVVGGKTVPDEAMKPRGAAPETEAKMPKNSPTEEELRLRATLPDDELRHKLVDAAMTGVLGWQMPGGQISVARIGAGWAEDPRLAPWTRGQPVLEISCANFSGNGARLSFAFTFGQLKQEFLAGQEFRLPPERFIEAQKAKFGMEEVCGEPSYLPGVLYERNLGHELFGGGPGWGSENCHHTDARCFLVLDELWHSRNALIRFVHHGTSLNTMLLEHDPTLMRVLQRPDVLGYHPRTYVENGEMTTELYVLLDVPRSALSGYLEMEELEQV